MKKSSLFGFYDLTDLLEECTKKLYTKKEGSFDYRKSLVQQLVSYTIILGNEKSAENPNCLFDNLAKEELGIATFDQLVQEEQLPLEYQECFNSLSRLLYVFYYISSFKQDAEVNHNHVIPGFCNKIFEYISENSLDKFEYQLCCEIDCIPFDVYEALSELNDFIDFVVSNTDTKLTQNVYRYYIDYQSELSY